MKFRSAVAILTIHCTIDGGNRASGDVGGQDINRPAGYTGTTALRK